MPMRAARSNPVRPSLSDVTLKALPLSVTSYRNQKSSRLGSVLDRVRCEFVEMRGFSPTVEQAARLFQINRDECTQILSRLVEEGFLKQTPDGRYRLPSQQ